MLRRVVPLKRTVRSLDGGQATLISLEVWSDRVLLRVVEPDQGPDELGAARWSLVDGDGACHPECRRQSWERPGQHVVEVDLPPVIDDDAPFVSLLVQRGVNGQPSVFSVVLDPAADP
ncbi:MAG: hypothetical protein S0880_02045 [Actinomycetota bacterium]|nr:hypothetical protein [Actinomycetota bacterium]